MHTLVRCGLFAMFTLVLFGFAGLAWSFCHSTNNPIHGVVAPFSVLLSEWNKQDRLEYSTDQLVRRNVLKSEIIGRLRAEQITLEEAVREFQDVMGETPVPDTTLLCTGLDQQGSVAVAENVLQWLDRELSNHPRRGALLSKYRHQLLHRYPSPGRV